MGKGGDPAADETVREWTWDEVKKHDGKADKDDKWIVVNGTVYNISQWAKKHPGGLRIIGHYAGQDATVNSARSQSTVLCIDVSYSGLNTDCV